MINAVIFDLGRVLVDIKFTAESLSFFGVNPKDTNMEKILDAAFKNELFRQFNTGKLTPKEFYYAFTKQHHFTMDFETFKQKWCSIFTPVEGMEELFLQVQKNYQVGLLSDTDPLHWNYCLEHFPFLRSIPRPTLSFEIGVLKPNPLCYQKAAQNVGFPPEECLFIDDRPVNIEGAQKAGMQGIIFKDAKQLRAELKKFKVLY